MWVLKKIFKRKNIFYVRIKQLEKFHTMKNTYQGKIVGNTINTFYNLYYDYWDLITRF